jgi:hypothetical protein
MKMRDEKFKEVLMRKAEETIDLLVKNGNRYGDDMLNLFHEQYPLMHCIAKCLRVKSMLAQLQTKNNLSRSPDLEMTETILEESRDILGYALLLIAIEEELIQ